MISEDARKAGKPKPNIGARLPHDVYAELVKLKDSTGKSESQLINEAIAAYLGMSSETVPDMVSRLGNDVDQLKEQIESILGKFQHLAI